MSVSAIFLVGCAAMNRPRLPAPVNPEQSIGGYTVANFKSDIQTYKSFLNATPPQLDNARRQRDLMIDRIMVDIESDYKEYEAKLFTSRAGFETGGDVVELGISTAATISNGARVKTILAAALSGVKGSRLSYSKNFFREKTTEVIISKMQASRNEIKNQITSKKAGLSVDQYPFEEAWADLIDFFYAGTLQGGLQALAVDAGSSAAEAAKEEKQTVKERLQLKNFSVQQLDQITQIRKKFNELYRAHNIEAAKEALKSLGVTPQENATEQDIFKQLNEEISKAIADPSLVDKLMTALKLK
jgi:hypothetical protein